jgi:hypothetical protein
VSKKHPQNGPTFSKSPNRNQQRPTVPSPDQQKAAAEQAARDAAKERSIRKRIMEDPIALLEETFGCTTEEFLKKKNYFR